MCSKLNFKISWSQLRLGFQSTLVFLWRYAALFPVSIYILERSENTLFWKLQKAHMVYGPRHNTDFRTIDEIIIGWISSCEIRKTVFTESVNYNTPRFQVIYLMNGIFVSIVTVSAVTLFRIIWNRSKCSPWGLLGTHRGPKRVHLSYLAEINMRSLWCSGRVQMALKHVSHI